ncbi:type II toxin-antitoxin system RelE/ParE family toxin [Serratia liquefaciens]|uniref:type II toxin-antitoxin system RelE/ParE family toxin n=1 Tax=Serratia liquefaciens TaxID=614 RepID=UPI0021B732BC|nr:type II toxin-antitoxin system RelE/ParE family toxin [Serratia liquefaciens]
MAGEAQSDIREIRDYTLSNWGIQQSTDYLVRLRQVLTNLTEMPGIGQHRVEDPGNGVYSFPYLSHMIYYATANSEITILAVLHQSRVPAKHLPQRL